MDGRFMWDPWQEMRRLQREMEHIVARVPALHWPLRGEYPPLNVMRDENGIVVEALFPGIDRASLDVTVVGDAVTIHGERNAEHAKAELVDEVRRLGTRYGIVTPYTSFLVVEEERMIRDRMPRPESPGGGAGSPPSDGFLNALQGTKKEADVAEVALGKSEEAGAGAVAGAKFARRLNDAKTDASAGVGLKTIGSKTFRQRLWKPARMSM